MKKAVLYARVSSSLQEKEGTIESQISELKRQIEKDGNVLVQEYIDNGYSGAMLSRPAMDQLRQDIKTKLFNAIYFHNADRIARDVTYQNIIIGEILKHNKQIIINGEDYVNNPENKFTLTVLGAVAELEKAKILERSMRGRQYRLKQGHLLGVGHQIYGYTYHRKTDDSFPFYTINKKEAEVIKYIFETYAKGDIGYYELAKHLNDKKTKKRDKNKKWVGSTVMVVLKNVTYTGIRYFNTMTDTNALNKNQSRTDRGKIIYRDKSDWVGIKIPAIISEELYDKVQERIKYNRECYRNTKKVQLLSGLVACGKCHSKCYVYRRYYKVKRKNGIKVYTRAVYKCTNRGIGAHNPELNSRILEGCIFNMFENVVFNPNKLKDCIDFLNKYESENKQKLNKKLKDLETKIKNLKKQQKRIIDLYSSGDLKRESYFERTNSYETDINSLSKEKSKLLNRSPILIKSEVIEKNIKEFCQKAKTEFKKCNDFESKRQFLLNYAEQIKFSHNNGNDMVCLYGYVPIDRSKLEFKIKDKVNRRKAQAEMRKLDPKDRKQILSAEYGKLINKNTSDL